MPNKSSYGLTIRDYDKELTRTQVDVIELTSGNFAAWNTALDNLQAGILGIVIGEGASDRRTAETRFLGNSLPTDKFAQRETKWIVRYEDDVTHQLYRNEIGTADLALLSGNDEFITVFPVGALATFKTAWEAAVLSPNGNSVTVISLQAAGKRL
jgi:hypothetical protein